MNDGHKKGLLDASLFNKYLPLQLALCVSGGHESESGGLNGSEKKEDLDAQFPIGSLLSMQ